MVLFLAFNLRPRDIFLIMFGRVGLPERLRSPITMTARIITSLICIAVGSFAFYTVWAKPTHSWSKEPLDQAIGIPKVVTRIIRAAVGLLFVGIGVVGLLRTFEIISG